MSNNYLDTLQAHINKHREFVRMAGADSTPSASKPKAESQTKPQVKPVESTPKKQDSAMSTVTQQSDCGTARSGKVIVPTNYCSPATTKSQHNNPAAFNMPTDQVIENVFGNSMDNIRVMDDAHRQDIDDELKKIVPKDTDRQKIYLALALALADIGSSPQAQVTGQVSVTDGLFNLSDALSIVKQHCTARQFARFYAKIVYQNMKQMNRPPDNWAGKGYPYEARFAAFDFFDAVTSPEAMEPPGGLKFMPTVPELRISNTNKQIVLRRREREMIASTFYEVTRGGLTPNQPQITWH